MAKEIIMPKVDMVMETGTFVEWLKDEGQEVKKGEPLFVIITEKASIECESPDSGILAGLRAKPDDVIPIAEVIGFIIEPGESVPEAVERVHSEAPIEEEPIILPKTLEPGVETIVPAFPGSGDGKVRATPVARRLAAELGVDLNSVSGRGPRGRIHKADVLAYAEQKPAVIPTPVSAAIQIPSLMVPLPDAGKREVLPLVGPLKIIADRMAYSASTAPHIALSLRADMNEVAQLRSKLLEPVQKKTGHKLSYTAILSLAVASVLPRHPFLNASLSGNQIILWEDVHLGIATSLEDSLIVPVIREAQNKNLEQIVLELSDLVDRAHKKRLTPSEMTGSTFTISNLGMFDIESFTAIINPPESAILAVGKIVITPVEMDGEVLLRPMMNMTLSADHRVVNGAVGAQFLSELKSILENPSLLI